MPTVTRIPRTQGRPPITAGSASCDPALPWRSPLRSLVAVYELRGSNRSRRDTPRPTGLSSLAMCDTSSLVRLSKGEVPGRDSPECLVAQRSPCPHDAHRHGSEQLGRRPANRMSAARDSTDLTRANELRSGKDGHSDLRTAQTRRSIPKLERTPKSEDPSPGFGSCGTHTRSPGRTHMPALPHVDVGVNARGTAE